MKQTLVISLIAGVLLASTALSAIAQDKVVLTMWHGHPEWKNQVDAIVAKFEESHPNIDIQVEQLAGQAAQGRLNNALAAGEAPDLFGLQLGPAIPAALAADQILDLTGKIDLSGLTQAAQDASTFDGKILAVPMFGSYTVGLYYQRQIFADAGLTPPTTSEEFFAVCNALQEKGIVPMVLEGKDGVLAAFTYMMIGSSILKADGFEALRKGTRKFTDPDMVVAAKYLQDMFPCFQEGALATSYTEAKALFSLGQGAMLEGGSADYAGFLQTNPAVDVGVVPFPAAPGGVAATVTGMQDTYSVNAKSKNPEAAIEFLQWVIGKEAAQMVADGITLSNTVGVYPKENRVLAEMVKASESNDVRVWYEFPETGDVFAAIQANVQPLFLKEITPEEFSARLQASVKPSGS